MAEKVYLITWADWEEHAVLSAHRTREGAEAALKVAKETAPMGRPAGARKRYNGSYDIEEFDLED